MAGSRFSRRILVLLGLGVGVPALLLAVLGVFLTLRVSREVARESVHYNQYIASQVVEAFEQELMSVLRSGVHDAEDVAHTGGTLSQTLDALRRGTSEF